MNNEFNKEILSLSREVAALKKQKEKSATTLQTFKTSITLTFDLEIAAWQGLTIVRSDKMAIIDFGDSGSPLVGVSYNISGLNDRTIRDIPYYDSTTGHIGRMIFIFSNNQSDLSTLQGGGTVTLTYSTTLTSTTELSVTTNYQDLWVY